MRDPPMSVMQCSLWRSSGTAAATERQGRSVLVITKIVIGMRSESTNLRRNFE